MLNTLLIKNYALINSIEIDFEKGLSTITGETGAGKSILLGALSMVLGKRADTASLNDKNEKCVVEAGFDIAAYNLQSFFEKEDIDYNNITIIRREILPNGKSRAFINDTPCNLPVLNELSEKLIDIHSQHETLQLAEQAYQYYIVDALAKNEDLLREYATKLKVLKTLRNELENFHADVIISDTFMIAGAWIKELDKTPVVRISVVPLSMPGKNIPPFGFGLLPGKSFLSRWRNNLVKWIFQELIIKDVVKYGNEIRKNAGLPFKPFFKKVYDSQKDFLKKHRNEYSINQPDPTIGCVE